MPKLGTKPTLETNPISVIYSHIDQLGLWCHHFRQNKKGLKEFYIDFIAYKLSYISKRHSVRWHLTPKWMILPAVTLKLLPRL